MYSLLTAMAVPRAWPVTGLLLAILAFASSLACGRVSFASSDGASAAMDSRAAGDAGDVSVSSDSSSSDSAPSDTSPIFPEDASTVEAVLVINELVPQMGDFAEIVNAGVVPLSLDGLSIADLLGAGDPPADPTHRAPVPAGITLEPGEHFVIAMNYGAATQPGLLTDSTNCRGAPRCIQTSFGVLAGGDTFAVLGIDGMVLVRVDFPGRGATGLTNADAWCRIPDVTGDFALCSPTPSAVNVPR